MKRPKKIKPRNLPEALQYIFDLEEHVNFLEDKIHVEAIIHKATLKELDEEKLTSKSMEMSKDSLMDRFAGEIANGIVSNYGLEEFRTEKDNIDFGKVVYDIAECLVKEKYNRKKSKK